MNPELDSAIKRSVAIIAESKAKAKAAGDDSYFDRRLSMTPKLRFGSNAPAANNTNNNYR